jgi:hypothetical protein
MLDTGGSVQWEMAMMFRVSGMFPSVILLFSFFKSEFPSVVHVACVIFMFYFTFCGSNVTNIGKQGEGPLFELN